MHSAKRAFFNFFSTWAISVTAFVKHAAKETINELRKMKSRICLPLVFVLFATMFSCESREISEQVQKEEIVDIRNMSLAELMELKVDTTSHAVERISDASRSASIK